MRTILVAEDDSTIRTTILEVLSMVDGWRVAAADTGRRLLEEVTTVRPDLIVLDVGLPDISGVELYRLLREREGTTAVPVLFVTAWPAEVARARLAGPHDWLAKPFDIAALVARAARLLHVPVPPGW